MAYTTSGQIPVGQSFKLGDYTFNLAVNPTGVIATVNDGEKGAAKGASFRNPQIKSWSVEANESEASVYVQFANEPDTYPEYISVIQPPFKSIYKSYEKIDLTGMVVQAFNADGTVWKCDKYPNGIIPVNELSTSPVNAEPGLSQYGTSNVQLHFDDDYSWQYYDVKIAVCNSFHAIFRRKNGLMDDKEWESVDISAPGYDIIVFPTCYDSGGSIGSNTIRYYGFFIEIARRVVADEPLYGSQTFLGTMRCEGLRYESGHGHVSHDDTYSIYATNSIDSYGDARCRGSRRDAYMPIWGMGSSIYWDFDDYEFECSIPFDEDDFSWHSILYPDNRHGNLINLAYLKNDFQHAIEITLNWHRPVDGKVLSTKYKTTIE